MVKAKAIQYSSQLLNPGSQAEGHAKMSEAATAPPAMQTRDFIYITFEIVVGFVSVFSNSVVLAVIYRTPRLHTVTNVFMGNLALADVMVGISVTPCASLSYVGLPRSFYGCVFINSILLMVTNVSILMMLTIAIERFIAIKEPFFYDRVLSITRAIFVNIFVWVLGLSLGMVPLAGWNTGYHEVEYCEFRDVIPAEYMVYFQFFGVVLLPMSIMLLIYIYIIIIVRKHVRRSNAISEHFQGKPVHDHFKKDVKSARWLSMVMLLFGIFWLPIYILNLLRLFCPQCQYSLSFLLAAIVMSHANSCINPFLYAASNSRIERAIKEMLGLINLYERHFSDAQYLRRTIEGGTSRDTTASIIPSPDLTRHSSDETLTAPRKLSEPEKGSVDPSDRRNTRVMRLLSFTGRVSGAWDTVKDVGQKQHGAEEAAAVHQLKTDMLIV